ncbi:hypothetical protein CLAFUW4_06387 [Fulvia fulva]|uniref:Bacteriocin-protection protein n=1 Tax=Passalora fulva TaxID=5499 RepID=A0A9Q8P8U4_PASFU|nr:uncharacterized protein CLAFUR5_06531 [Fulvia fulva]KAK4624420.1 hypothetical protein CLAFUR4_06390 [Fulvia fulva]KAK4624882.1 hypothetical protein CLAFUR0_06391 [Fulvia fulva]UJO17595.1 hypothetical protein CLAFUR5_06531 [Fulvia fulva]WPV14639.1 hypothetical protein CLAFUW4_06387 [Fulvia fulva]WPV30429.1 hypothetical protein CLAFUW7_06385 [Fulvia fulva]
MPAAELPVLTVATSKLWRRWLAQNSSNMPGVWLTVAKKGTTKPTSMTYADALDEALCCGWIDSRTRKVDEYTNSCRFTPRAPKGLWSKRNVGYIERLLQEGRMQPAGLAQVKAAKADGRWDAAYSAQGEPPEEFFAALKQNPGAQNMWDKLNKGNRWHIYFTLLNLKTEAGKAKRIQGFVEMLARGETPVPQKSAANKTSKRAASAMEPLDQVLPREAVVRKTRSGRNAPSYSDTG